MENPAEIRMNNSLEPIPEETGLPRISQLIPKSPETRKREQEYRQLYDDLLSNQKQRIEIFYEMLVVNRNLKRISHNGPCIMGNYTDCGSVWSGRRRGRPMGTSNERRGEEEERGGGPRSCSLFDQTKSMEKVNEHIINGLWKMYKTTKLATTQMWTRKKNKKKTTTTTAIINTIEPKSCRSTELYIA